jgi:hypothetical protein
MFIQTVDRQKIELTLEPTPLASDLHRLVVSSTSLGAEGNRVAHAAGAFFGFRASESIASEPPLGVFRETETGIIRVVHKEIVLRWGKASAQTRKKILTDNQLQVVAKNPFIKDQIIVRDETKSRTGADLVGLANKLMEMEEIVFATPQFCLRI